MGYISVAGVTDGVVEIGARIAGQTGTAVQTYQAILHHRTADDALTGIEEKPRETFNASGGVSASVAVGYACTAIDTLIIEDVEGIGLRTLGALAAGAVDYD